MSLKEATKLQPRYPVLPSAWVYEYTSSHLHLFSSLMSHVCLSTFAFHNLLRGQMGRCLKLDIRVDPICATANYSRARHQVARTRTRHVQLLGNCHPRGSELPSVPPVGWRRATSFTRNHKTHLHCGNGQ